MSEQTTTTFSLGNLFSHVPIWASIALTIWSAVYGIYLIAITYELLHLSHLQETHINGIYAIGNLIFLGFGAKKKESLWQRSINRFKKQN